MNSSTTHTWTTTPTRRVTAGGVTYAYRELGRAAGTPLVVMTHLAAVLDDWDPRLLDGLAATRGVVAFDDAGVGASTGTVPTTIGQMARDATRFLAALGLEQVDVLATSMGATVAQEVATRETHLVRRLVLAATGNTGGKGITRVAPTMVRLAAQAVLARENPKDRLFFTGTPVGRAAAQGLAARLAERTADRDEKISGSALVRQTVAVTRWGGFPPPGPLGPDDAVPGPGR